MVYIGSELTCLQMFWRCLGFFQDALSSSRCLKTVGRWRCLETSQDILICLEMCQDSSRWKMSQDIFIGLSLLSHLYQDVLRHLQDDLKIFKTSWDTPRHLDLETSSRHLGNFQDVLRHYKTFISRCLEMSQDTVQAVTGLSHGLHLPASYLNWLWLKSQLTSLKINACRKRL